MTLHQHRIISTTATVLLLGAVLATPAAARQDPGPPPEQKPTFTSCPLTRVGTQLVRCDNLTGNGVSAPRWKTALNAFAITFADRMPAAENL